MSGFTLIAATYLCLAACFALLLAIYVGALLGYWLALREFQRRELQRRVENLEQESRNTN